MTLLDKLIDDQGFINALTDCCNLSHDTVRTLLSDYHEEIFTTCDITENMLLYPPKIVNELINILKNYDLYGINSETVEIAKQSVKRRAVQLIPYFNKKELMYSIT